MTIYLYHNCKTYLIIDKVIYSIIYLRYIMCTTLALTICKQILTLKVFEIFEVFTPAIIEGTHIVLPMHES